MLLAGCDQPPASIPAQPENKPSVATNPAPAVSTNIQTYAVKGVVKEYEPGSKVAKIRHEDIPGFMKAMTMDLEAKTTNEFLGLKAGDVIAFRMNVTDNDAWIDQVQKLSASSPTELPSRQTVHLVKDVDPLNVGDALPEYHFTNELGQAVNLSQFKGEALAITFIFTTCPYPTFCPRMSQNFSATAKKLKEMPNAPTNWRMLSITIDPETDTPQILKAYGERDAYKYDPQHWSFLTGDLIDITAMAEQFGLQFWREAGTINHKLRTVVIDAEGRVKKIIPANEWTPDELAAEILKAAEKK